MCGVVAQAHAREIGRFAERVDQLDVVRQRAFKGKRADIARQDFADFDSRRGKRCRDWRWAGRNLVFIRGRRRIGDLGADNLARVLKKLTIDQVGSVLVHADPAAHFFIPYDGEWPKIDPSHGKFLQEPAYSLVASLLVVDRKH